MSRPYLYVMCANVRRAKMFALIVLSHAQSFAHIIQTQSSIYYSIAFIIEQNVLFTL